MAAYRQHVGPNFLVMMLVALHPANGNAGDKKFVDYNECMSGPCKNNATCLNGINSFICTCLHGYWGVECEKDVNECALANSSAPCQTGGGCANTRCQNNGQCLNTFGSFKCLCQPGVTGARCEKKTACISSPCANHSSCTPSIDGASFQCHCSLGYTGRTCTVDINECTSSPCANKGNCTNQIPGFTCQCTRGLYGTTCEITERLLHSTLTDEMMAAISKLIIGDCQEYGRRLGLTDNDLKNIDGQTDMTEQQKCLEVLRTVDKQITVDDILTIAHELGVKETLLKLEREFIRSVEKSDNANESNGGTSQFLLWLNVGLACLAVWFIFLLIWYFKNGMQGNRPSVKPTPVRAPSQTTVVTRFSAHQQDTTSLSQGDWYSSWEPTGINIKVPSEDEESVYDKLQLWR